LWVAKTFGAEVFATVSPHKARLGATPIDYKALSVQEYVAKYTDGVGFDVILRHGWWQDAGRRIRSRSSLYRTCIELPWFWDSRTGSAVLPRSDAFRRIHFIAAHHRGGRLYHGEIMAAVAKLADERKLRPIFAIERFISPQSTKRMRW
jgi:NADPH2:quinone reductase